MNRTYKGYTIEKIDSNNRLTINWKVLIPNTIDKEIKYFVLYFATLKECKATINELKNCLPGSEIYKRIVGNAQLVQRWSNSK